MSSPLRADAAPRACPTPRAATAPSAAATCRRPWCRRSIGCRPASTAICTSAEFQAEFNRELKTWVGRPTALSPAPTLSKRWGAQGVAEARGSGAYRRAQDQQRRRARRCWRSAWAPSASSPRPARVSTASRARPRPRGSGMPCVVYMGAVDVERQAPNVGRMKLLGATVVPVTGGDKTLRAAIDEALRDWVSDPDGTYYSLGSAVGPHPYPYLVRELQSVIGREARAQMLEARRAACPMSRWPASAAARTPSVCSIRFSTIAAVQLLGVEAGGRGAGLGDNAASLTFGTPGVLQGSYTLILQDAFGQVRETHSVSAGLDYSGVGPEHALPHEKRPGRPTSRRPMRRRWTRSPNARNTKAFCRPSKARTRFSARGASR